MFLIISLLDITKCNNNDSHMFNIRFFFSSIKQKKLLTNAV